MKTIYFFKVSLVLMALFAVNNSFGQVAKTANFVEKVSPVHGVDELNNPVMKDFNFAFECGAAWGDYNNDGYLDLIVAGVSNNWAKMTTLYKNNGDGTFTTIENPFPLMRVAGVAWLDFDNDGNLDLLLSGQDDIGPYTALYKNLGSSTNYSFQQVFDGQLPYINNGSDGGNRPNRYLIVGDYNNDGWVDIYLTGGNETGRVSLLYKNLQGKGFEKVETPVMGTKQFIQMNGGSSAFGDINNDGYLDLLSFGYFNGSDDYPGVSGSVGALYVNNGDGTFAEPTYYEAGEEGEIALADYNNDGFLDFVITGYSWMPGVGWQGDLFENTGMSSFTRILPAASGIKADQQNSHAWGDVNNDGYEDLLYMKANPNGIYMNNTGDQTFTKYDFTYTEPIGGSDPDFIYKGNQWGGSACLVDFDRDGNLDAFTAAYGFTPRLMRNTLADDISTNAAPTAPTNLAASVLEDGSVAFSWNAGSDDTTPQEALKYNLYVKKDGENAAAFVLPADITTGRLKVNETLAPIVTTSYKIKGLAGGNYTFGVQAIDNAKVASLFATGQFTIEGATAVKNVLGDNVKIVTGNKSIEVLSSNNIVGNIAVYTVNGKQLYTKAGAVNNVEIQLPAGIYLVKIVSDNNSFVGKAVVK